MIDLLYHAHWSRTGRVALLTVIVNCDGFMVGKTMRMLVAMMFALWEVCIYIIYDHVYQGGKAKAWWRSISPYIRRHTKVMKCKRSA